VIWREQRLDVLRVEPLRLRREADQVDEDDGDDLSLGARGPPGLGKRQPALGAEFRACFVLMAAGRAGGHMSSVRGLVPSFQVCRRNPWYRVGDRRRLAPSPTEKEVARMYARVASFEGRDSSLTDQLIQRVRDQGPSSVPDAKGFLGLFDREGGTSLGITFFDSEEAIRNSEQAFEDMAQHFPNEMRGRRVSVDVHEIKIMDGDAERAKAARVSSLEGSPGDIDESVDKARSETLPKVRELKGNVGVIALADRKRGRVTFITLWESADALRESEQQANKLREQAAERGGQRIADVDNYEVAVAQQLSGVHA
jgi:heme-degrading monooxygenase HmoA